MTLQVYAIWDTKTRAHHPPFYTQRHMQAVRFFERLIKERGPTENEVATWPEDFALMHLGTWDDETGQHTNLPAPAMAIHGKDVVAATADAAFKSVHELLTDDLNNARQARKKDL